MRCCTDSHNYLLGQLHQYVFPRLFDKQKGGVALSSCHHDGIELLHLVNSLCYELLKLAGVWIASRTQHASFDFQKVFAVAHLLL